MRVSSNDVDESAMNEVKEVEARVFGADSRPVVLFDGVCNMCNGGVNFILDWDNDAKLRVTARNGTELTCMIFPSVTMAHSSARFSGGAL